MCSEMGPGSGGTSSLLGFSALYRQCPFSCPCTGWAHPLHSREPGPRPSITALGKKPHTETVLRPLSVYLMSMNFKKVGTKQGPECVHSRPQAPTARPVWLRLALVRPQDHVWNDMTHPHGPRLGTAGSRPDMGLQQRTWHRGQRSAGSSCPLPGDAPTSDVLTHTLPGAMWKSRIRHAAPLARELPKAFPGTSRHRPLQRRRQGAKREGTF